ncbi:MAG: hypothetical protein ABW043_16695 [Devosia sp.]|uniref:hypothetical protein n=1 Tax=Devosia sp. TaxID=1871048 RepID=UPI003399D1CD
MIDMAAAFAGIARGVSAAFGGPFMPGTLERVTKTWVAGGSTVDSTEYLDVSVQIDAVTERLRSSPVFTDAEVRLLVLRDGLDLAPTSDDFFTANTGPYAGVRWKLTPAIGSDPMGIGYECAGRRA